MGRNNHNGHRTGNYQKRRFNIDKVRLMVQHMQESEDSAIMLNAMLLFLPWGLLFGFGVIVSPVQAYSNPGLDTSIFVVGGVLTGLLIIVLALMLKKIQRSKPKY